MSYLTPHSGLDISHANNMRKIGKSWKTQRMKILMPGGTFIIGTALVLVLYCNQYCTFSIQNIKTTKSPPAVTCPVGKITNHHWLLLHVWVANNQLRIPWGKRGNIKNNHDKVSILSPPQNPQVKRGYANRSVITCHGALWLETRLLWLYTYMQYKQEQVVCPNIVGNGCKYSISLPFYSRKFTVLIRSIYRRSYFKTSLYEITHRL